MKMNKHPPYRHAHQSNNRCLAILLKNSHGLYFMRYCCAVLELLVTLRLKGNQDVATCKYLSMNVFASFNTSTLRCPLQYTLFLWSLFCLAREINMF